jgi:hypothetical protein
VEVGRLKKLFLSLFALAFIFSFNVTVLADEGHSDDSNVKNATENFRNGTTGEQKDHSEDADTHSGEAATHEEEADAHAEEAEAHPGEADVHTEAADAHSDAADGHSEASAAHGGGEDGQSEEADTHAKEEGSHEEADTHAEEEGAHEEEEGAGDHHGPVVETLPNYKVLGSYGAVNLSFILIGVWNKWFRRKGIK